MCERSDNPCAEVRLTRKLGPEAHVCSERPEVEIKNSPEFDETLRHDEGYRTKLGSYYGPEGKGYRDS